MRPSLSAASRASSFHSIEWSPKVATAHAQISDVTNCHFVLPDLPNVLTQDDRVDYLFQISPPKRIVTVSACRYTPETLAKSSFKADKLLLVGGNLKSASSLSTTDAAKIILNKESSEVSNKTALWGVTNPNDPGSVESVHRKIDAGITGFITQPLLSSQALDILESYPRGDGASNISFIAGMAMPRSARNLQFWCKLLEQPDLENDPLFKAHLAFFSQPYFTSMAWIGRELENLYTRASIDGIHFMPIGNTEDLIAVSRTFRN